MNTQTWTTIISDAIVLLGVLLNYLKTRSVGKSIAAQTPPVQPKP